MTPPAVSESRLAVTGASKHYGGVPALKDVDLTISPGTIHGLIGENGAGKSTLIKILAGATLPDAGNVAIDGIAINPRSPRHALEAGITTVYQDASVVPAQSVAENILLGRVPVRWGRVQQGEMRRRVRDLLAQLEIDLPIDEPAGTLSIANRQLLQIARGASYGECKLLILDEPTSALTPGEAERLFGLMRRLRADGVSIVFVSHRLNEVLDIANDITVLRDGKLVWTKPNVGLTEDSLAAAMMGREALAAAARSTNDTPPTGGPTVLEVEDLSGSGFSDVSLTVRPGEIVGIFGLVGSGRSELLNTIFGAQPASHGSITVAGEPAGRMSIRKAIALGVALVPEDRKAQGLVSDLAVGRNLSMAALEGLSAAKVFVRRAAEGLLTQRFRDTLRIKTASLSIQVSSLSGGNQQKVVLGKWLAINPKVLLLDEPTAGIDVGAKREIYEIIRSIVHGGAGVLIVSSELAEVLELSDRVVVLREGRVAGTASGPDLTADAVFAMATQTATAA